MASIVDQTPTTAENSASVFETKAKEEKLEDVPETSAADNALLQSKVCQQNFVYFY